MCYSVTYFEFFFASVCLQILKNREQWTVLDSPRNLSKQRNNHCEARCLNIVKIEQFELIIVLIIISFKIIRNNS